MKLHELFLFAIDTIKGEYPEEQWPDYHVPEMERAAAVLPQLIDNVQELLKLDARRNELMKQLAAMKSNR